MKETGGSSSRFRPSDDDIWSHAEHPRSVGRSVVWWVRHTNKVSGPPFAAAA